MAIAAATALLLAGCGSDSDSSSAEPTSAESTSAESTSAESSSPSTDATGPSEAQSQTTSAVAASDPGAPICASLQTISEADAATRDPNVQTWEQQRDLILSGSERTDSAYAAAIDASDDDAVTRDLQTVRDFTAQTIAAVQSSDSFETFGAQMGAVDPTGATEASLRLNDYSTATCGFPLSTGG